MRRAYSGLIAIAIAIIAFHEFSSNFARALHYGGAGAELAPIGLMWALPSLAAGVAVGAALVVASASRAGVVALRRLGMPGLGRDARARANGMTWGAIALLAVHFTRDAFQVFPGGHVVAAVALGASLGYGTFRLHRHAIEHEAYRTFNLVAMLPSQLNVKVLKDGTDAAGGSILGLMMLGAAKGDTIEIHVAGDGAEGALAKLAGLVKDGLGED